jgi:hypothetical protein
MNPLCPASQIFIDRSAESEQHSYELNLKLTLSIIIHFTFMVSRWPCIVSTKLSVCKDQILMSRSFPAVIKNFPSKEMSIVRISSVWPFKSFGYP